MAHSQASGLVRHRLHPQCGQWEDVMSGELDTQGSRNKMELFMHTFLIQVFAKLNKLYKGRTCQKTHMRARVHHKQKR